MIRYSPCSRVVFLSLAVLLLMLAGCAGRAAAPAPADEIRIGLIASFSGKFSETSGRSTSDAAQMAVKAVNDAGGLEVNGRRYRIVLVQGDDQDNQQEAVKVAQKLINQENVVAIVGPQFSRNAIPVASVVERAQIPMISPMSTSPETTAGKQYVFRVGFVDDFQGSVVARFVREEFGADRAAVLYDVASAYNKGLAEVFKQRFEAGGGEVVAFESYTTGEQDFTAQLMRIKESQPQALFLPNYDSEVMLQAKQIRALGLEAPIIGSDSWNPRTMTDTPELDGAFYSHHWHMDSDNPQSRPFVTAYRQQYQRDPTTTAAMTYDALGLLFQAIQQQGRVDPTAIRNGLAAMQQYAGVSGTIRYQGGGDPVKSAVILQLKDHQAHFYKLVNP
jgi:branched-chain amino acid transport system substrate-binding protein